MVKNMVKPICLIAARGGSKGVPKKNIREIFGKPLIAHTVTSSLDSNLFSHVIVSTDNKEIAKISKNYGAEVPSLRPKKLAESNSKMDDVVENVINELFELGYMFDILVNRDCTAPFIRPTDIKKSINLLKKEKCDTAVAAYRTHLNPYFNMMEFGSKKTLEFSKKKRTFINNRQDAPVVYQLTGFQTINVKRFQKFKKIYMPKVLPVEIPPETGLMIDTEFEFSLAECIFKKKY
jgi:CMP-N,N'-diacetyllegionaminic acid synthase